MFGGKRKKYNLLEDHELIQLFRDSNKSVYFGIIYERYAHLVIGVCLKYLRDEAESQDLTSKIFEELGAKIHKYTIENFKAWLYRLVKNECLMHLRKQKFTFTREYDLLANEEPEINPVEKEKQLSSLESALDQLNELQQTCVRLFYIEGKSYVEIASSQGLEMNKVKSAIQNGKRNLKIIMQEHEINEA